LLILTFAVKKCDISNSSAWPSHQDLKELQTVVSGISSVHWMTFPIETYMGTSVLEIFFFFFFLDLDLDFQSQNMKIHYKNLLKNHCKLHPPIYEWQLREYIEEEEISKVNISVNLYVKCVKILFFCVYLG